MVGIPVIVTRTITADASNLNYYAGIYVLPPFFFTHYSPLPFPLGQIHGVKGSIHLYSDTYVFHFGIADYIMISRPVDSCRIISAKNPFLLSIHVLNLLTTTETRLLAENIRTRGLRRGIRPTFLFD